MNPVRQPIKAREISFRTFVLPNFSTRPSRVSSPNVAGPPPRRVHSRARPLLDPHLRCSAGMPAPHHPSASVELSGSSLHAAFEPRRPKGQATLEIEQLLGGALVDREHGVYEKSTLADSFVSPDRSEYINGRRTSNSRNSEPDRPFCDSPDSLVRPPLGAFASDPFPATAHHDTSYPSVGQHFYSPATLQLEESLGFGDKAGLGLAGQRLRGGQLGPTRQRSTSEGNIFGFSAHTTGAMSSYTSHVVNAHAHAPSYPPPDVDRFYPDNTASSSVYFGSTTSAANHTPGSWWPSVMAPATASTLSTQAGGLFSEPSAMSEDEEDDVFSTKTRLPAVTARAQRFSNTSKKVSGGSSSRVNALGGTAMRKVSGAAVGQSFGYGRAGRPSPLTGFRGEGNYDPNIPSPLQSPVFGLETASEPDVTMLNYSPVPSIVVVPSSSTIPAHRAISQSPTSAKFNNTDYLPTSLSPSVLSASDSSPCSSPASQPPSKPNVKKRARGRPREVLDGRDEQAVMLESKTTSATISAANKRRAEGSQARFQCTLCGETFTRKYNLKGHERAHRNEKPYVCSTVGCEKAFARAHDCKRHEVLHTKVKKFGCSACDKDFVRLDALQRHHRSELGQSCVVVLRSKGLPISYDMGHGSAE